MNLELDVILGRQPVLDKRNEIFAYELLFRTSQDNWANVTDDLGATSNVLINTLTHIGIDNVIGKCIGFVNVSKSFLMSDLIELLPPDRIYLELLENIVIDDKVITRCIELTQKGYQLILDDFIYSPQYDALLPHIKLIKLDVVTMSREEIHHTLNQLQQWTHIQYLAEKVENEEAFNFFHRMGFDYFQGFYFEKPSVISTKSMPPNYNALLKILKLARSNAEIIDIETAFKKHADLVISLLRLVNSAATGVDHKIDSVSQALAILGQKKLVRWIELLFYSSKSSLGPTSPLMQMAAVRGRMMELLSESILKSNATLALNTQDTPDKAFMVGVVSLLDVVLEMPMEDVLNTLGLDEESSDAVLLRKGYLGNLLSIVSLIEQADFEAVNPLLFDLNISKKEINAAQLAAYKWTSDLSAEMH